VRTKCFATADLLPLRAVVSIFYALIPAPIWTVALNDWWADVDLLYWIQYETKDVDVPMDAMISIILLLAANFMIAWTRQLSTGWVRVVLSIIAVLLLLPAFLFGIRAIM